MNKEKSKIDNFGIGPLVFKIYKNDDNKTVKFVDISLGPYGSPYYEFSGKRIDDNLTEDIIKLGYDRIKQFENEYKESVKKKFGIDLRSHDV